MSDRDQQKQEPPPASWVNDVVGLAGLGSMSYGLFIFEPWVSFTVCGAIVLCLAVWRGAVSGS